VRAGARMSACVVIGAVFAGGCEQPPVVGPEPLGTVAPVLTGGVEVPAAARGVEIRVVPVFDAGGAIGAALAPYEGVPVGADPLLLHRWREAGLRLVAVPERELGRTLAPLRPARLVEATWWADIPSWRALYSGAWFDRLAVDTGAGVRTLGAGRVRLLVRAWFEPMIEGGSIVTGARLELVPQHQVAPTRGTLADLAGAGELRGAGDEGEAFGALALGFGASGEMAYVIVGESPDVDWRDPDAPTGGSAGVVGPVPARVRTLGEAMLNDEPVVPKPSDQGRPTRLPEPVRVMIVIRPRLGLGGRAGGEGAP